MCLFQQNVDHNLWYFLIIMCGGQPDIIKSIHSDRISKLDPDELIIRARSIEILLAVLKVRLEDLRLCDKHAKSKANSISPFILKTTRNLRTIHYEIIRFW